MKNTNNAALAMLRHHVTGSIERGEAVAIVEQRAAMTYRNFAEICRGSGGVWRPGNVFSFPHTRIALGATGKFLTRFNAGARGTQDRLAATEENLRSLISLP